MEQMIDIGLGVPTRVVSFPERERGFWEVETQVDIGQGFERLMSYNAALEKGMSEADAFAKMLELAQKNGAKFFEPWLSKRSTEIANAKAKAAEDALRAQQYDKAAPLRTEYANEALRELGRRSDEKSAAADSATRLGFDPIKFLGDS